MLRTQIFLFFLFFLATVSSRAQTNLCTYAGGVGAEQFNDVLQLSNGDILVGGSATALDWLPANVPLVTFSTTTIDNSAGNNKFAFLLLLDSTGQQLKKAFTLPQGEAEEIRFIKTDALPNSPTGNLYVSGTIENTAQGGGYFLGKLNNNFVNGDPTGFTWTYDVKAKSGDYPKRYQPWDVGSDGKIVFAYGDSHDNNWSAIYRLNTNGVRDVVPQWRMHWPIAGGEHRGVGTTYPGGLSALRESGIVFKKDANRCELRSMTQADYDTWSSDGNGGTRKGKWPLDVLFNGPCMPGGSGNSTSGRGYTGYAPSGSATYGPSSIAIDRRTNHLYIGFNSKSVLPSGLPDFEPAVMAMDGDGALLWWSRLYHEVTPTGDTMNSTPDQYIDAIAIDYSKPVATGEVVVAARAHGNNVENLWEGNTILANPSANGFQNRFTGTNGNIHLGWIGKLGLNDGTLYHSTYVGEYNNTSNFGAPHPDPNLDGFPNPNSGWPNLNTTYIVKNAVKITADGSVIIIAKGRRTITTKNAFQKMTNPYYGGQSAWNSFVRVYKDDLSVPTYSSLIVGQWDTVTQVGGGNTELYGVHKTNKGLLLVGGHDGTGNEMPTASVPTWGSSNFSGESAIFAYLQTDSLEQAGDGPNGNTVIHTTHLSTQSWKIKLYPNPSQTGIFSVSAGVELDQEVQITDIAGRVLLTTSIQNQQVNASQLPAGSYWITFTKAAQKVTQPLLIVH